MLLRLMKRVLASQRGQVAAVAVVEAAVEEAGAVVRDALLLLGRPRLRLPAQRPRRRRERFVRKGSWKRLPKPKPLEGFA